MSVICLKNSLAASLRYMHYNQAHLCHLGNWHWLASMELSHIHLHKLVSIIFYSTTSRRIDKYWLILINIDEWGRNRCWMPPLHPSQALWGTAMEGNGWLRDSATYQDTRNHFVGIPQTRTVSLLCIAFLKPQESYLGKSSYSQYKEETQFNQI